MRYKPEMKLNQLERFQYHPFYEWLVYSNDLDKVISLDESLEKQGIDKGDILEVISSRKPFESFENESNF